MVGDCFVECGVEDSASFSVITVDITEDEEHSLQWSHEQIRAAQREYRKQNDELQPEHEALVAIRCD